MLLDKEQSAPIHANERNSVWKKDGEIFKKFGNKREFERETHALRALKKHADGAFLFPDIIAVDEVGMIIRTRDISLDVPEFTSSVSFENLSPENVSAVATVVNSLCAIKVPTRSADSAGMIQKAFSEGENLDSNVERHALAYMHARMDSVLAQIKHGHSVFVHGDIYPDNMIFDREGNFKGLLDWGHAGMGIAELDLRQFPVYFGRDGLAVWKAYEKLGGAVINKGVLDFLTLCRFMEVLFHTKFRLKDMERYDFLHSNLSTFLSETE